jgi:hypothetical protein
MHKITGHFRSKPQTQWAHRKRQSFIQCSSRLHFASEAPLNRRPTVAQSDKCTKNLDKYLIF